MGYDLANHHKTRHPGVTVTLSLSGSARTAWKQTERVTLGCLNTIFALFSSQKQAGNAELKSPPLPLKLRTASEFSSCHPQSQVTPLICQSNCQGGFPPSSPCGWLRMDAPEALKGGTRHVKFGADQEGAHRQKRDRRVFPPRSPLLSSSQRTKVGPGGEEEVETSHAGRNGSGGEMDLCDSSRGFVGARLVRFIRDLSSSRCRCDAFL